MRHTSLQHRRFPSSALPATPCRRSANTVYQHSVTLHHLPHCAWTRPTAQRAGFKFATPGLIGTAALVPVLPVYTVAFWIPLQHRFARIRQHAPAYNCRAGCWRVHHARAGCGPVRRGWLQRRPRRYDATVIWVFACPFPVIPPDSAYRPDYGFYGCSLLPI